MTHVRWIVGVLAVVLDAALARIWPPVPVPDPPWTDGTDA